MSQKDDEMMPVGQAAKYIGKSFYTLQRWDREGKFKAHLIEVSNRRYSGTFSKRNVVFDDITVDRDQLASLNIALEQSGQKITDFHKRKSIRTHLKSRRKQNYNAKKQVLGFKGDTQIVVFLHDTVKHILTFMQLNKNTCNLDNNLANRKDMSYIRPYELV